MPLFRVAGRFADNFTFSVNPVDGADAREALNSVMNAEEVRAYGKPVVMVSVKALGGSKKHIRISDKPAAERKGGGRKKKTDTTATATPPASAAQKKK